MPGYSVQVGPAAVLACGRHVHDVLDRLPLKARAVAIVRHADPKECGLCPTGIR